MNTLWCKSPEFSEGFEVRVKDWVFTLLIVYRNGVGRWCLEIGHEDDEPWEGREEIPLLDKGRANFAAPPFEDATRAILEWALTH